MRRGGPRAETRQVAVRERARHRRAVAAEDRPARLAARPLTAHHDGNDPGIELVGNAPGSRIVAEARRWIGTNPTTRATLWCARFMNFVLERIGLPGTASDLAKSFASYGKRLEGPKVGAIAVMNRGKSGGHVGVVSGFDKDGDPVIISGNYSRRVAEAVFDRSRIIAYVFPEL
ncbi:MAG: TIGR02594 family protein [Xanthobacteraceae bacterium]|nr:TIGR02594 family protein [Xanthobacteraceae bacterium]